MYKSSFCVHKSAAFLGVFWVLEKNRRQADVTNQWNSFLENKGLFWSAKTTLISFHASIFALFITFHPRSKSWLLPSRIFYKLREIFLAGFSLTVLELSRFPLHHGWDLSYFQIETRAVSFWKDFVRPLNRKCARKKPFLLILDVKYKATSYIAFLLEVHPYIKSKFNLSVFQNRLLSTRETNA